MLKRIHPSIVVISVCLAFAIAYILFLASIFVLAGQQIRSDRDNPTAQPSILRVSEVPAVAASPLAPAPSVQEPEPAVPSKEIPPSIAIYTGGYSAEMTSAGISESDKSLVASLMMTGDTWANQTVSPMSKTLRTIQDPTQRIGYANYYVQERWGSWQAAADFAQGHEGNW